MSSRDRKNIGIAIERLRKKSLKSEKAALKTLIGAGIATKSGKLRHPYKNLCIPQKQA